MSRSTYCGLFLAAGWLLVLFVAVVRPPELRNEPMLVVLGLALVTVGAFGIRRNRP